MLRRTKPRGCLSFADLLSEIALAKRRKAALQDAIICRASADVNRIGAYRAPQRALR